MALAILRFALGLVVGFVLLFGSYVGLKNLYDTAHSGAVGIHASGADMSAQGVTRLVIKRDSGVISQACNGPCDDLRVESRLLSDVVKSIRATNIHGDCVACAKGGGDLRTGRRDDWAIVGSPQLAIAKNNRRVTAGD